MKITWDPSDPRLSEIGALAFQTEMFVERLQWRVRCAQLAGKHATPISLDELDLVCEKLTDMTKRMKDLRDRVVNSPKLGAQAV